MKEYERTGYVSEQYDANTGEGREGESRWTHSEIVTNEGCALYVILSLDGPL